MSLAERIVRQWLVNILLSNQASCISAHSVITISCLIISCSCSGRQTCGKPAIQRCLWIKSTRSLQTLSSSRGNFLLSFAIAMFQLNVYFYATSKAASLSRAMILLQEMDPYCPRHLTEIATCSVRQPKKGMESTELNLEGYWKSGSQS